MVVFLVALPLALGVALASGVPPVLGLASAAVGGIVVGSLAGCRLQVTGPAAGLVVLVFQIVDTWGLGALGVAVLVSGALQLVAGLAGLGRWFRAVSPALVHGLLAGIGGLIVLSQLHVVFAAVPPGGGLADLVALPGAVARLDDAAVLASAALGVGTVAGLFAWDALRKRSSRALVRALPGALVAVVGATAAAAALDLPVAFVELPDALEGALPFVDPARFALLGDGGFVAATLALTGIAAAESLLSASATDRLHDGPRTDHDRELRALGVGNVVCGVLGALPVTGVIVRSAANVEAGARTRWAAVLHGVWVVALVAVAPGVLAWLPVPALAGLLVYIGVRLLKPAVARQLHAEGHGEVWVYLVTAVGIVLTGLLTGLMLGFALAVGKLLWTFSHLAIDVRRRGSRVDLNLRGAATFLGLPKLADALEQLPSDAEVHVHIGGLHYVDHACHVLLREHEQRLEAGGGKLLTEWDDVRERRAPRPMLRLRAARRDPPVEPLEST